MKTRIWRAPPAHEMGRFASPHLLDTWEVSSDPAVQPAIQPLREAAALLRQGDIPVAFPTETVYGLGADATRSAAVRAIYAAKGRPSDNPLIVHVCDLDMLRGLLRPATATNGTAHNDADPIPDIYRPLLARFWPGPLTILLPSPQPASRLAPEVSAGLPTFGARLPASALARTLIKLAGVPLAAPSANASTRPSPTSAAHVLHDLDGRIGVILDGGPCGVGLESTVVDGLCRPPAVLRPGAVGLHELRAFKGWEGVVKAYKDADAGAGEAAEAGGDPAGLRPPAPGMKYKHYSPSARVVLFEATTRVTVEHLLRELRRMEGKKDVVGVIRTRTWSRLPGEPANLHEAVAGDAATYGDASSFRYAIHASMVDASQVFDICLGPDTKAVAHGLFSALRELDTKGTDVIFIEGVEDADHMAAAVMNRLRKAASEIRA